MTRIPDHLTGSDRPGGGDPLADYLHLKGEHANRPEPDIGPLMILWRMVQADDEDLARQLRDQAVAAGANARLVAHAWGERDRRIAEQVTVIHTGGAS